MRLAEITVAEPVVWPRDWEPDQLQEVAATAFALLFNTRRWVHRRSETITFIDANSIGRRISVDFTVPVLPEGILSDPSLEQQVFVPLSLLRKRVLRAFDLRDADGGALPMLTRTQNSAVARTMLLGGAQSVLGDEPLRDDVIADLTVVASDDRDAAEPAFKRLIDPAADCPSASQRAALMAEPRLRSLAEDLVHSFVFLVPLTIKPGARKIVKFAYEEEPGARVRTRDGTLMTFRQTLGWEPVSFLLPASSMGDSASYHVEVTVPDEVEVCSTRAIDLKRKQVLCENIEPAGAQRVHVYHPDEQKTVWGLIEVSVLASRAGLLTASFLTSLITALMLTFGLTHLHGLAARADSSSALLLGIPALFAGYLLRPNEHPLVTRLFAGLRALVLIGGLCAMAGTATLISGVHGPALTRAWATLTGISWVACGALALALLGHNRAAQRVTRRSKVTNGGSPQGLPPRGLAQAIRKSGLDLDGLPVESAEGWRSGFDGIDSPAGIARTLELASQIRADGR